MPIHLLRSLTVMGGAVIIAAAACVQSASGQTFDVKQPEVKRGYLELGLDNTLQQAVPGAHAHATRGAFDQSLDYGVTDWWRLSAVLKLENPTDDDFRAARTAVENLFVLSAIGERSHGIGWGWFTAIEAAIHPDATNALIFGPIATVKLDKLSFTANPFFEKTFGQNHEEGIALSYGWQVKYELQPNFAVGIEGFGHVENLGNSPGWENQEHRVGPVIYAEIEIAKDLKITPDIGVLFGLTPATPDVAFKFNIGVPLHQR